MRQAIDEKILNSIKETIIRKLNLNKYPELIQRLNKIEYLYVEDLTETIHARMQCRPSKQEIAIDKQFCLFDKNNKVVGLDPSTQKLIYTQLGHELLHAVSADSKNQYSGINDYTNDNNRGLNEGITQMITEDIFGYTLSPFTDSIKYQEFKKVAKIIKNSIGYKPILNSYFFHTDDKNDNMKDEFNKLSNDKTFYEKLNKQLTNLYYLAKTTDNKNYKGQAKLIITQRMKIIYYELIINIVIPKLKTLSKEDKHKYISNIIKDISDNKIVEKEIISILKSTINLSNEQLNQLKINLSEQTKGINEREDFINNLYTKPKAAIKRIFVEETGVIKHISSNRQTREIKNEDLMTDIYLVLYNENKNYQLSNSIIQNVLERIKKGEEITFNTKDIKKRKIWFSKIKEEATKQDILILNSYKDLNTNNNIKIKHINIKNGILSFEDLKIIAENYSIQLDSSNNFVVTDKKYNKTINNARLKSYAIFANMWLTYAAEYTLKNESIKGLSSAFDTKNRTIYDNIMTILQKNIKTNGELNFKELEIYNNNQHAISIFRKLFQNQTSYQYVYNYMRNISDIKSMSQNELSYAELETSDYEKKRIESITNSILKR